MNLTKSTLVVWWTGPLSELLIFFAKSARLHSAKTDETNFGGFGTIRMACFPVFKVPFTPDEVDVLDAGDAVEGVGWRRVTIPSKLAVSRRFLRGN